MKNTIPKMLQKWCASNQLRVVIVALDKWTPPAVASPVLFPHLSSVPLQVAQFQEEVGKQLPALVYIDGTESCASLIHLVAFTGRRFLRSAAQNDRISFDSETEPMQILFSVIGYATPTSLSLDALDQLLCACAFATADAVLDALQDYLAPGIAKLHSADVRSTTTCLPADAKLLLQCNLVVLIRQKHAGHRGS